MVVVDKPAGMTSHDVVSRVRRIVGSRKVGHAGTLDPMATGVLVLGVERATRLLGHFLVTDKAYDATVRLGATTVTDDFEGETLVRTDASGVTDDDVRNGVRALTGPLLQRPSTVSAIKVAGVRAHARVRAGEDVELAARPVTVSTFEVHDVRHSYDDGLAVIDLDVSVVCTSGTYVRALARDLGADLGVGGHLTALRRTRVGSFDLAQARTLDELTADAAEGLVGMSALDAVRGAFGTVSVDAAQAAAVLHGNAVPLSWLGDDMPGEGLVGVTGPDGTLLSLSAPRDGALRHLVVFS
ncbi:MAG: tRNA pseudouridine(55) synthase TruB [Candidatus Nanopelagicales bacterium]